jgi:hypothetical protein
MWWVVNNPDYLQIPGLVELTPWCRIAVGWLTG